MKMNSVLTLLNFEQKTSAKGNQYVVGLFMQGIDTLQLMFAENVNFSDLPINAPYLVEVDYNPRFKSLKMMSIKPVK